MTSPAPEIGLRERKKRATRAQIERCAVNLVVEHGYDAVTVDMICRAAEVSPSTFFNYFGTKDAAVLGVTTWEVPAAAVTTFNESSGSILLDALILIRTTLASREVDRDLSRMRFQIIHDNGELLLMQRSRVEERISQLREILTARLRSDLPDADEAQIAEETHLLIGLIVGIIHQFPKEAFVDTRPENWFDLVARIHALTAPADG